MGRLRTAAHRVGILEGSRVGIFDGSLKARNCEFITSNEMNCSILSTHRVGILEGSRVGIFDGSRVGMRDGPLEGWEREVSILAQLCDRHSRDCGSLNMFLHDASDCGSGLAWAISMAENIGTEDKT